MLTKRILLLYSLFGILLFGCAVKSELQQNSQIQQTELLKKYSGEKLLSAYPESKPQWIFKEPEQENGFLFFVGISSKFASEKEARENAYMDCIKKFAAYCGVEISELYRSITIVYGVSSDINDPVKTSIANEKQVIDALVSRVKTSEWYVEKWAVLSDNEILDRYYKVFVKCKVPEDEYRKVIEQKKQKEIDKIQAGDKVKVN